MALLAPRVVLVTRGRSPGNAGFLEVHMEITEAIEERFLNRVKLSGACWLWTGRLESCGSPTFKYQNRYYSARRVSAKLYGVVHAESDSLTYNCASKSCVRPSHIVIRGPLGYELGRNRGKPSEVRGETVPSSKLIPQLVQEIRAEYATRKTTQVQLAKKYQVDQRTISQIVNRETWRHLP